MNIFGMGWEEMMVILIIALIVFGPGKLPEVMGQVGKAVRDFRRMTSDLTGEFEKTIGGSLDDVKQQLTGELSGITAEVNAVTASVKRDLNETVAEAAAAGTASTATVAGLTETTAVESSVSVGEAPVATKADPLADVSLFDDAVPDAKAASNGHGGNGFVETEAVTVVEQVAEAPTGAEAGAENGAASMPDSKVSGDALARARQRRLAAGYNRRVS